MNQVIYELEACEVFREDVANIIDIKYDLEFIEGIKGI